MKCKICGKNAVKIFDGKILNKYTIDYFYCVNCEHLQTQEDIFWLDEAYSDAIAMQDTGIMTRNMDNSILTGAIIFQFYDRYAKFLDFAGGYGILTRLMRDAGFDFYWQDKYAKNLTAKGFEYREKEKIELLTAFECFEHFSDPMKELEKMFEISPEILFSQNVYGCPPPKFGTWWYYAPNSGQHISFYSNKTLDFMAKSFNKKCLHAQTTHIFCEKEIKEEDFKSTIENASNIYAKNMHTIKSKVEEDMNYIIKN